MSAKTSPPRPILHVPEAIWEQTPPLVQDLLVGLHQQVRQLAEAPKVDPILNIPLEMWNAADPLIQQRLIELCHQVDKQAEQIQLLRSQLYGSSAEKLPKTAPNHNDTPPAKGDDDNDKKSGAGRDTAGHDRPGTGPSDGKPEAKADNTPTPPPPPRRRRGFRKPLPTELPRVIEIIDVDEAEKQCGCGKCKACIGEETAERIDYSPGHCFIRVRKRRKWACPSCEGVDDTPPDPVEQPAAASASATKQDAAMATPPVLEVSVEGEAGAAVPPAGSEAVTKPEVSSVVRRPVVTIAPVPKELIPKGIATAGLLAHIVVSKFLDGLPLYRQQAQFARIGVRLARSTMCRWLITVYTACIPLLDVLHKEVLSGRVIGADESPMQVIKEPNRAATTQSYMWTFRGGTDEKPAIQLVYDPTRSGDVAKKYLRGHQGAVQTDGFSGYDFLDLMEGIVHLGCMAHSRRKFVDVLKALGKDWKKNLRGVAGEAILTIRELYAVEREADSGQMTEEERYALRQAKAKPLMDSLHEMLLKAQVTALPSSKLGDAIGYTLNQWHRLERYLETGHYRIDNNLVENVFRLFAVGRRNWLFCYSQEGARASACFYSLILTAKANGIDPYWYLRALFERLPYANPKCEEDYRVLLPQYIDRALVVPKRL
jgi:transposase